MPLYATLLCDYPECDRAYAARGYCNGHYQQLKGGKQLRALPGRLGKHEGKTCVVRTCTERRRTRDWCRVHYHYWVEYKVDPQVYEDMLEAQGGTCAVCNNLSSSGRRLALDHDHETGELRGLLCANCNRAVGLMGDSIELLEAAIEYLKTTHKDS